MIIHYSLFLSVVSFFSARTCLEMCIFHYQNMAKGRIMMALSASKMNLGAVLCGNMTSSLVN